MFNRTRRRLAILNALVFLLILSVMSSLLYVHMRQRLYHETDETVRQAQYRVQSAHNLMELLKNDHPDPQLDERTTYLFWDAQGQLIGQSPKQPFDSKTVAELRGRAGDQGIQTLAADKHRYRVLIIPSPTQLNAVASIGIVRSLEDTESTLRLLLWDIAGGVLAGAIISILAGLFLAERALIPIRESWEKQQRFVTDASHELRTPTAVIHAQTELLLRHPDNTIEQESPGIAVVLKESKRMGKLVDDLLTLARSDSNQLQIHSSLLALDSLLAEVAEQFRFLAQTMGIEIATDIQKPLSLQGDEGRIRQLLIILLDNALKYTPASGRIEITGHDHAGSVAISITDTGCGIAEEDLPHIFERFYRGDKARSRTLGGTGLGLSIARWIVDAHDGAIKITSKVNEGTRVEVLFPRKQRGSTEAGSLDKI